MNVIKRLFESRKFVVSLTGLIVMIAVSLGLDEGKAKDVAENVVVVVSTLVIAIAVEDAARNLKTPAAKEPGDDDQGGGNTLQIAAMLAVGVLMLGAGGCAGSLAGPEYVAADRATYEAVAPDHARYVAQDATLTELQRARRQRTLATWQSRIEAQERANGTLEQKPVPAPTPAEPAEPSP